MQYDHVGVNGRKKSAFFEKTLDLKKILSFSKKKHSHLHHRSAIYKLEENCMSKILKVILSLGVPARTLGDGTCLPLGDKTGCSAAVLGHQYWSGHLLRPVALAALARTLSPITPLASHAVTRRARRLVHWNNREC